MAKKQNKRTPKTESTATSCRVVGDFMGPVAGNLERSPEQGASAGATFCKKNDSTAQS
jgi:hypothetical protein